MDLPVRTVPVELAGMTTRLPSSLDHPAKSTEVTSDGVGSVLGAQHTTW